MRTVRVEIRELVVDGFERVDEARVGAAATQELERLIAADSAWPTARGAVMQVAAPATLPPGSSSDDVGRGLAQVVHRELGR